MKTLLHTLLRLFAFVVSGVLVWVAYLTYPYWSALFAPTLIDFSRQSWQAAHRYKRLELARDFLDKHVPVGMSKEEVVALLGIPDHQTPHSLTYLLSITAADFMALSFHLDERGRVVQAIIHQT